MWSKQHIVLCGIKAEIRNRNKGKGMLLDIAPLTGSQ